jgi:hypothetical protein
MGRATDQWAEFTTGPAQLPTSQYGIPDSQLRWYKAAATVDAAFFYPPYHHFIFDPHRASTARHIVNPTPLSPLVATLLFTRNRRIAYRRRAFPSASKIP